MEVKGTLSKSYSPKKGKWYRKQRMELRSKVGIVKCLPTPIVARKKGKDREESQ